jgi:hypothetical protein
MLKELWKQHHPWMKTQKTEGKRKKENLEKEIHFLLTKWMAMLFIKTLEFTIHSDISNPNIFGIYEQRRAVDYVSNIWVFCIFFFGPSFLGASKCLYKRLRPLVVPSVVLSVCRLVPTMKFLLLAYVEIWLHQNCFAPGPSCLFWVTLVFIPLSFLFLQRDVMFFIFWSPLWFFSFFLQLAR